MKQRCEEEQEVDAQEETRPSSVWCAAPPAREPGVKKKFFIWTLMSDKREGGWGITLGQRPSTLAPHQLSNSNDSGEFSRQALLHNAGT